MYRIAICDDITQDALKTETIVSGFLQNRQIEYQTSLFARTDTLLNQLKEGEALFHLFLLDILMSDMNGIELARHLRQFMPEADIIFITSSPDFALESFDASPAQYLLKPVDEEKLTHSIGRSLKRWSKAPPSLLIQTRAESLSVPIEEISYLEVYRHMVEVHTETATHQLSSTLSDMERLVPSNCFIRCHKSYLVNMQHIREIHRYEIGLKNGEKIPIGRPRYITVQEAFIKFAAQNSPVSFMHT